MKPKFGIIGCGDISRFHFNGLKKAGADIVYIADINEAAAKKYVDELGARFSKDYKDLLADPEVTVVSVLTSAKYHKEICIAALQAGKDVICEKTMSNNAEEAFEIAKAAEESGQLFFMSYMKRFFPAVKKAKELLPKLGRIFSAQVRAYQAWGNLYELEHGLGQQWILDGYGGAIVKCAGSHMIDMTLNLLGRPERLYAHVDYIPNSQVDRKAAALFEYGNGLVVNYETAAHALKKIGYERNSWDEYIEINGVGGRLRISTVMWDHSEKNAALLVFYDNETDTSTEYRFNAEIPFDAEMQYFYECLCNRVQGAPNVVDGFNTDIMISAIMESGFTRMPVVLDWQGL
ncbi:gfo/Idh/MocA family oxidoreductase [Paenibacillus psychroresistens]|uniref:Gfo/Idh/MocA family oxidoreductase n=1 Tax=Paenibacillus psychroresistens TaxID=1778678 RepID=A0A6B8RG46_9BACL|nr:Gfo/Idh/MocA family oxidoreductase [Paenibacillus psychroresistens]QGQ94336.1 gfo/Idh/MocA family oxidoreductase [Paenibacillus psychroresistens]